MPRSAAVQQPQEEKKHTTKASSRPARSTRKDFEAAEKKVGQDSVRRMKSTGPAREALEPGRVVAVERVISKEKADALVFMEDVLTIIVHQSTNPTDEPYPEVWNDGVCQRFQRGVPMKVKRKYVEVLARCKRTAFSNEKAKDPQGNDIYRYPSHTALRYPFAVQHDPAGDKGRAWLEGVLAEA